MSKDRPVPWWESVTLHRHHGSPSLPGGACEPPPETLHERGERLARELRARMADMPFFHHRPRDIRE